MTWFEIRSINWWLLAAALPVGLVFRVGLWIRKAF